MSDKNPYRTKLRVFRFGGCRLFTLHWRRDLYWYATSGFWGDLRGIYHRVRYGYHQEYDAIDAGDFLAGIMAPILWELATNCSGAPCGYPHHDRTVDTETDYDQWRSDLFRWAKAAHVAMKDEFDSHEQHAQQQKDWANALIEMAPWWGGLWD